MNEPIPPRVLAAEERRAFRDLLSRGALGCPRPVSCGHLLSEHDVADWDGRGNPVGAVCRYCDCGVAQ